MLKRILDIVFCSILIIYLFPITVLIALWMKLTQGGSIFFVSDRIGLGQKRFRLWKFRTLVDDQTSPTSGGPQIAQRITPTGRFLRRTRLDELPQLWNVLRGDMSFVGPRPPLPHYVEKYPEVYHQVLKQKPGVTGLASLVFHQREEDLLNNCLTQEHAYEVYCRQCVPRKAKLDLIYQQNQSIASDFGLVFETIGRMFMPQRMNAK